MILADARDILCGEYKIKNDIILSSKLKEIGLKVSSVVKELILLVSASITVSGGP